VLERFYLHYRAHPVVQTRVYDGIPALLDHLAPRATLAILSNKPHDLTVAIAERLLGRWPFAVIAGQRPGIPLKPSPEPALIIAEELGVPPDACVLVGDSPSDVVTARAAGMVAAGVSWGFRPRAELVAAEPKWLADTPADLRALV
jgi:phosphoglycolate phosphatase